VETRLEDLAETRLGKFDRFTGKPALSEIGTRLTPDEDVVDVAVFSKGWKNGAIAVTPERVLYCLGKEVATVAIADLTNVTARSGSGSDVLMLAAAEKTTELKGVLPSGPSGRISELAARAGSTSSAYRSRPHGR
jgi:hypothetical protein